MSGTPERSVEMRAPGGLRLRIGAVGVVLSADRPLQILASAVVGGGLIRARHILNMRVPPGYAASRPRDDLLDRARDLGLSGRLVGLMTAARTEEAAVVRLKEEGLAVTVVVTVGITHPTCAGRAAHARSALRAGTINTVVVADALLTPAALVNAVMTVTEAKTLALGDCGVRTSAGDPATGTPSDAVVIACTRRGTLCRWAGPVTVVGRLMARAVHAAVVAGIERSRPRAPGAG